MDTVDNPTFDQAALDRFLSQFELSGPAVPEGVEDFCVALESWIDEGLTAGESMDEPLADLLFIRGMVDTARGDYESAIARLHDSVDKSRHTGNHRRHIHGLCTIAVCFEYAGMQDQASDSIFQALELAESLGDRRVQAAVLHGLSTLFESQGSHEQMLESALRTHAVVEELDDRQLLLRSCNSVSLAYAHLSRCDEGLEWLMKALDLIDDGTPPAVETYLKLNLMYLHRRAGRLDEAVRLAHEHLPGIRELPAQHAAVLYVDLAELHLAVGDLDRSAEMLERADQVADSEWMKAHLLGYFNVAAQLHEARDEPSTALELLRQYMRLEDELRGRRAQTRLVAIERYFAAELAAKTDEVHQLRTVELVDKNDQLTAMIEKNAEILQVVVNDLKNPLAATRLLADLLMKEVADLDNGQALHLVESITSATVEMSDAVSRLLESQDPDHAKTAGST